jgi:hypothetical protein
MVSIPSKGSTGALHNKVEHNDNDDDDNRMTIMTLMLPQTRRTMSAKAVKNTTINLLQGGNAMATTTTLTG